MKKTLLATLAVLFLALSANAQVSVGAGYAKIGEVYEDGEFDSINGFYVSAMNNTAITNYFSINTGLRFMMGKQEKNYGSFLGTGKEIASGIEVPVEFHVGLKIADSFGIGAYVGPYASFGITSKYNYQNNGINATIDWYDEDNLTGYYYDRFDFGAVAGVTVDIMKHLQVKVGHQWGLIDTDPQDNQSCNTRVLTAGIAFIF